MLTPTPGRPIRPLALALATTWLVLSATVVPAGATSILEMFGQRDGDRDRDRIVRSGDKVRFGSGISVDEDEIVNGDVVSIFGSARVDGQVTGDTVVVLGDLTLGPDARVENVTVVGGELRRSSGARVTGELVEVGFGRLSRDWFDWDDRPRMRFGLPEGAGMAWTLFRLMFLALIVAAVVFVAPATVRRVAGQVEVAPWKAGLLGFGIQILFIPVLVVLVVVLAVSIIGIPFLLLIPFVILGFIVASLVGFAGVAFEIGRWVKSRGGTASGNMFAMALLGVVVIIAFALIGRGVALGGGLFSLFAAVVLVCAFLIEYAAWTVGMGAAALAGFSGKRYSTGTLPPGPGDPLGGGTPPAPTGPPPPAAPPAGTSGPDPLHAMGPSSSSTAPAAPPDAAPPQAFLGAAGARPAAGETPKPPETPPDFDPELRIVDRDSPPGDGDPPS